MSMMLMYQKTNVLELFECAFAPAVWIDFGLNGNIIILPNDSVIDILVCWSPWNRRNKLVWNKVNTYVFAIKATTLNLLTT